MITDLTFASGYRVELLEELPGRADANLFYIPPHGTGGQDGLLLAIRPENGDAWSGCFAFGRFGDGVSALIASPRPDTLFVVSDGAGYVVNIARAEWSALNCAPIRDVRVITDYKIVLFADFTGIYAYGSGGFLWQSKRLCWDDLRIISIAGTQIVGSGYDPISSDRTEGRFELDLLTGRITQTDFAEAYERGLL